MKFAIFWDIDGTLANTDDLHREKTDAVAKSCGITLEPDFWNKVRGLDDKKLLAWFKDNYGLNATQEDFTERCESYLGANAHKITFRSGAREAFEFFASLGIPQCAVSSGTRTQVDLALSALGLDKRMMFSLSANDVENTKPHPEPYLKAIRIMAQLLDCPVTEIKGASIEDSVTGSTAGFLASLISIYWRQPNGKPNAQSHIIIDTPEQLLAACKQITERIKPLTARPPLRQHALNFRDNF